MYAIIWTLLLKNQELIETSHGNALSTGNLLQASATTFLMVLPRKSASLNKIEKLTPDSDNHMTARLTVLRIETTVLILETQSQRSLRTRRRVTKEPSRNSRKALRSKLKEHLPRGSLGTATSMETSLQVSALMSQVIMLVWLRKTSHGMRLVCHCARKMV